MSDPTSPSDRSGGASQRVKPGKRSRVVLAEGRKARRVVRTLAEVEEQTPVGEVLVRQLVRAQLNVAIRLGVLTAATLGLLPLVFWFWPVVGEFDVLGVRLPWLLLGFAVYPFLLWVAWMYIRSAERNERDFADMVES